MIAFGTLSLPCLALAIYGLRQTTIHFDKEVATASTLFTKDISIPLNNILCLERVQEIYGSFPYPRRRFRIEYFNAEGKTDHIKFSILLDESGNSNLSTFIDVMKFRNPNFEFKGI
jgi:hypothetical protein